ncbi:hypothetical protein BDZ31_000877 [Conexibacter arvalis]|uniref:Uncharacterized protein n=1 Tax=Conexibacter arvalis TaxID=912552 RepID=A0A840IB17_9ACTN|nr:hypothetical protein [Conexibacter arvalis]
MTVFPASQVVPLLRAIADPEGTGRVRPDDAATLRQVERNVAAYERRDDA